MRLNPLRSIQIGPDLPAGLVRGAVTVAASSLTFGVAATSITWFAAAQRHAHLIAALPRLLAADAAAAASTLRRYPNLVIQPMDWPSLAPAPSASLNEIAAHVLAQTSVFVAVATLVTVLYLHGRTLYAGLAAVAAGLSVAAGAGPLGLLPGTLAQRVNLDPPPPAMAHLEFAAPVWWRAVAMAITVALLAAIMLMLRGQPGAGAINPPSPSSPAPSATKDGAPRRALWAVASFLAVAEATILIVPAALTPDGNTSASAVPLAGSFLLLGVCGAVAGSRRPGRHGVARPENLLLIAVAALAWVTVWATYHRDGGAPAAFGWGVMGEDIPWYGTKQLATLALASPTIGWLGATAAGAFTRTAPVSAPV